MSTPKPPNPAKLVIGAILQEKSLLATVTEDLGRRFGGLDLMSSWLEFNFTPYYEREMGSGLFRRIMVFKTLIQQEDLAGIKIFTNRIEKSHSSGEKRRVNLDPGYLLLERFVLATGKNFSHRIHIGQGIYADLTLIFEQGRFKTLPWTYPDYASSEIQNFLLKVREKYKLDLKAFGNTSQTVSKHPQGIDP